MQNINANNISLIKRTLEIVQQRLAAELLTGLDFDPKPGPNRKCKPEHGPDPNLILG